MGLQYPVIVRGPLAEQNMKASPTLQGNKHSRITVGYNKICFIYSISSLTDKQPFWKNFYPKSHILRHANLIRYTFHLEHRL